MPTVKQTTRQFVAGALARSHGSVFLPPCIKLKLQNPALPPGASSFSLPWVGSYTSFTLLICYVFLISPFVGFWGPLGLEEGIQCVVETAT